MNNQLRYWIRLSLFNFLIVAALGVLLRYKILFPLPIVDQKHLLHAHSHFAFAGWITQILMALMVSYLSTHNKAAFFKYKAVLYANVFTAIGMLLSFPFQGYGSISITFSMLSLFVSYWFALKYWQDLNRINIKSNVHLWFKAANIFAVISSAGALGLAYMMANKMMHDNWYLASIYFFLHFQYNGWFFFGCAGLFSWLLLKHNIHVLAIKKIFWLFAVACIPAYLLSVLWLPIPTLLYCLVIVAAFLQISGWLMFIVKVKPFIKPVLHQLPRIGRWLLGLSAVALTIKLLLQLGSTVPALSVFAFGLRPIVIGYLHLVLLAVISLFLLGFCVALGEIRNNRILSFGAFALIFGIFSNELLLMVQGIAAIKYNFIPYTNEMLLVIASIMFLGILVINVSQLKKKLRLD